MSVEKIEYLVQRYFNDACTLEEKEELARWVNQSGSDDELREILQEIWNKYEPSATMPDTASDRILAVIFNPEAQPEPVAPVVPLYEKTRRRIGWRIAAGAAVLILVSTTIYLLFRTQPPHVATALNKPTTAQSVSYIRNITLADGSIVVLQAGSTLQYDPSFGTASRELVLNGEAYFDVAHNAAKPFIIHTGKITTTVLGTAFNISAWPGKQSVSVSVTRGKVKVEKDTSLLAVLLPDQQITYNLTQQKGEQQRVDAKTLVTDWTKQDMVFEETPFDSIAAVLMKRYNVTIRFANTGLSTCPVHAYFNGTEKLEKVLNVLCKVRDANYTRPDDKTYVIDGEGCNPDP